MSEQDNEDNDDHADEEWIPTKLDKVSKKSIQGVRANSLTSLVRLILSGLASESQISPCTLRPWRSFRGIYSTDRELLD